jgi:hypothetical protein
MVLAHSSASLPSPSGVCDFAQEKDSRLPTRRKSQSSCSTQTSKRMRSLSFAVLFVYRRQTPLIHSLLRRTTGRNIPFRAYAHWRRLETTGRQDCGQSSNALCLACLRYATSLLDARAIARDYRPICAQFEYRLMSLRRLVSTLRAPSPLCPPWAFVHFGVRDCLLRHKLRSIAVTLSEAKHSGHATVPLNVCA